MNGVIDVVHQVTPTSFIIGWGGVVRRGGVGWGGWCGGVFTVCVTFSSNAICFHKSNAVERLITDECRV